MKHRIVLGILAIAALASASAIAGDSLKSGPAVGSGINTPFHPLNVTGKFAGKKNCLV